jgi:hypothetical protein
MADISAVLVLLIGVALAVCIWALIKLMHKSSGPASPPPPPAQTPSVPPPPPPHLLPGVSIEDPWKFYSMHSVDGKNGVDIDGNLCIDSKVSTDPRWQSMDKHLSDYPFRGPLEGGSWQEILDSVRNQKNTMVWPNLLAEKRCLLVEAPAVVILTGNCTLEGLVVRRGGTVLLAPGFSQESRLGKGQRDPAGGSMTLSLQFGICESGGLIQCGFAGEDREARLPANLSLVVQFLDAPQGFMKTGAACSQYSYRVHTPGVTEFPSDPQQVTPQCESDMSPDMLGGCVTNVIGPKAFGCLFNGNLHLAGSVPLPSRYSLWKASCGSKTSSESFGSQLKQLDDFTTPRSSYATCWTACTNAVTKGTTTLATQDDVHTWPVGSQVVVTCHSAAWVPDGAYMDYRKCTDGARSGGDTYTCPEPVIDFYVAGEKQPPQQDLGFGVEVAVIESASTSGITLKTPLLFNHSLSSTSSFQAADGSSKVQVDTPVHVGLLSRNIRICGKDTVHQVTQVPAPFEKDVSTQTYAASQNLSSEERARRRMLMPVGRMNNGCQHDDKHSVTDPSTWCGQAGAVTCDFSAKNPTPAQEPGFYLYYASESKPSEPLGLLLHDPSRHRTDCGSQGPVAKGSSLLGDEGDVGLGSILGATLKFQYGCGVVLDGVELYRMGIPANTGSLGQYSLHFHCAGWGPAFEGYVEKTTARRFLRVANSVNWRSYSRWCVLHGTNFADISNNVFCVCMGNGVFTEDGVEHHNNIEHNLMVLNVQTGQTQLAASKSLEQNPGGVVGNFGPDGASSASIWLTNTHNYVYRNVLCCNPAYGAGIWAVALNPRSKAAPATHCVGSDVLGLPGLVGNSLASWDPTKKQGVFLPAAAETMASYFSPAQGGLEAIGNIKNLGLVGGNPPGGHLGTLQSCPYLAENVVYSMCAFYVETSPENAPWVDKNQGLFVANKHFIPINGNTTGSFLLNNAAGNYPEAAGTSVALNGAYVARVFSQNLCYSMQGMCIYPSFGGFVWTQVGNSVLVGNCVLGGDYWSNPSSLRNSPQGDNIGNYATVLIDMVTNVAVSGSSQNDYDHKNLCKGTLVSGPKTMLGLRTCTGSSYATPPKQGDAYPDSVVCEASNDGYSASWVAFADGIEEGDVDGMLKIWLGGGYNKGTSHMPLRGVREDMTCFPPGPTPAPESLNYAFLYDARNPSNCWAFSTTPQQDKMVSKLWSPKSRPGIPCASCIDEKVDQKYKELYPILSIPYVEDRWDAMCSAVKVLPAEPP